MTVEPLTCGLCERPTDAAQLTQHHLTPKSRGGRETVSICQTCHQHLHATFTNKQLASELDTLERLRAAPELIDYLQWIARQKPTRQFRRRRTPGGRRARRRG